MKCFFCEKTIKSGDKVIEFCIYTLHSPFSFTANFEKFMVHYDCYINFMKDVAEILEKLEKGVDE